MKNAFIHFLLFFLYKCCVNLIGSFLFITNVRRSFTDYLLISIVGSYDEKENIIIFHAFAVQCAKLAYRHRINAMKKCGGL